MALLDFAHTFVLLYCMSFAVEAAKFYQIDKHSLCKDVQNGAAKFSEVSLVGKKQAISITAVVETIRNIKPPVQFRLSVNRCELDKTNCVPFDTITFDDVCPVFNENHIVKAYMGFFSPPLTCPMQVGKYTARNGLLDMRVFEGFSIGNAHWQTEMRVIDGTNKTEICTNIDVTITEKDM